MESITVCVIDSVLRISGLSQLCINLSHKRIPSKHTTLDELRNSGVEHVPSLPVQCPHLKKNKTKKNPQPSHQSSLQDLPYLSFPGCFRSV